MGMGIGMVNRSSVSVLRCDAKSGGPMLVSRWFILALVFSCSAAAAQSYPTRPVRMIVPQAPGSASDTVARIVAAELTQRLKQQVVVDNRPGGALLLGL